MVLFKHKLPFIVLLLLIILSACTAAPQPQAAVPGQPTPIVVRILNLDAARQVTPTTPPTFTPLPTLPPTDTPIPAAGQAGVVENTPIATPTPSCRNAAEFVKMVNGAQNINVKTSSLFAFIWQVRNVGDCTWNETYSLVLVGGEALGAPVQLPLTRQVGPGETIDLRVDVVAPETPGPYQGSWMLQAPDGTRFGVGTEWADPLLISLNVQPPPRGTPG